MKFIKRNYLLLTILTFILLRIPSLFEPHWYVDEGMYATGGMVISSGGLMYQDFYDHKPQLMFYLWALLQNIPWGDVLFNAKLLNILLGVISILGIDKLAKYIWNRRVAALAVGFYTAFAGTIIIEGNIANAENVFVPMSIWAIYLAFTRGMKGYLAAGLMFGLASLIKFHPLLDFAALIIYTLITFYKKSELKESLKLTVISGAAFALIQFLVVIWEFSRDNLFNYIEAAYLDAFLYSGETATSSIIMQITASPVLKIALLTIILTLIIKKYLKSNLDQAKLFLYLLLVVQIFGVLLSGRAYGHYFLHSLVAGSFWFGVIFSKPTIQNVVSFAVVNLGIVLVFVSGYSPQPAEADQDLPWALQPIEYYYNFAENAVRGKLGTYDYYDYFNYDQRALDELTTFASEHEIQDAYIYSDMGWAYYDTGITPPTPMFVAFQIWYQDAEAAQAEIIADLENANIQMVMVDNDREMAWDLGDYIEANFVQVKEGEYFNYFARVDGRQL